MKRRNILVIEDDHAIRDIIAYVLLAEGYNIITADKLAPVEEMITYQPELIVLDEWVNTKESSLLCHEIKEIHELAHIPVVIISTSHKIASIALSCKADGYVRKPFDIDDLLAEITRCLNAEKQARSY